jgi:hypothetical protein
VPGVDLALASLLSNDAPGASPAVLTQHGDAFDHSTIARRSRPTLFTVTFLAASTAAFSLHASPDLRPTHWGGRRGRDWWVTPPEHTVV